MTKNLKLILFVFRTKFHELLSDFPNYETIFADGSKDGDTAGSACVTPSDTYNCRLPDNASIYTPGIRSMPWGYNVFVFSLCVCVCVCVSVNNFRVRSITLKPLDIFS